MSGTRDRQKRFEELLDTYKSLIVKVCYIYSSPQATVDDLYQEVAANLWTGLDRFRGDSKVSTWIYRTAINTCITWVRRNKHASLNTSLEGAMTIADDSAESLEREQRFRMLHDMISHLMPIEKAIVTMWLDDKPYSDIAAVTGLSVANVATRLHRIKEKLSKRAKTQE
ncbi:MAG: sigma-70 family RNA polymerase sigma factor [Bacteroides sp.]|nr:sigma-70 family RNA polymerase sigma factor [Bacteroides sp.]MBD5277456.1 sigma-70 family RNA polymerase sigma factor [Bacteroides sp.]